MRPRLAVEEFEVGDIGTLIRDDDESASVVADTIGGEGVKKDALLVRIELAIVPEAVGAVFIERRAVRVVGVEGGISRGPLLFGDDDHLVIVICEHGLDARDRRRLPAIFARWPAASTELRRFTEPRIAAEALLSSNLLVFTFENQHRWVLYRRPPSSHPR